MDHVIAKMNKTTNYFAYVHPVHQRSMIVVEELGDYVEAASSYLYENNTGRRGMYA